jgi:hypothetical protein
MHTYVRLAYAVTLHAYAPSLKFGSNHRAAIVGKALQNIVDGSVQVGIRYVGEVLHSRLPNLGDGAVVERLVCKDWVPGHNKTMLQCNIAHCTWRYFDGQTRSYPLRATKLESRRKPVFVYSKLRLASASSHDSANNVYMRVGGITRLVHGSIEVSKQ